MKAERTEFLDLIWEGAIRCPDNFIATARRCLGSFVRLYMLRGIHPHLRAGVFSLLQTQECA
jgi:hypothetical protein